MQLARGRKFARWFGVHFSLGMPPKAGFCPCSARSSFAAPLFPVWEYKTAPFHRDPRWATFAQRSFLCIPKQEYSFSVYPIGCTPVSHFDSSVSGFSVSTTLSITLMTTALSCAAFCDVITGRPVSFSISCRT